MVTSHRKALADRMRLLCLHGLDHDAWNRYGEHGKWYYEVVACGFKYNLSDVQAAIGIHQLRKLDKGIEVRAAYAHMYNSVLGGMDEFEIPPEHAGRRHAWHLYPLRLNLGKLPIDRKEFIEELRKKEIGASVHFIPIPLHPFFGKLAGARAFCPNALELYPRLVSLPLYPAMSEEQVRYVAGSVREVAERFRTKTLAAGGTYPDL